MDNASELLTVMSVSVCFFLKKFYKRKCVTLLF